MCGISGIINFTGSPVPLELISEISDTMIHRGPDDSGIKIFKNVAIAHKRLSIIDIKNGTQPLSNENNTIWITYNGEIYNFKHLRTELIKRGHLFKTETDTEVIIHLYEEHGENFLNLLNGMFAFAIYDSCRRTLLLAIDRLGQKPCFFYKNKRTFIFASELQAITKHPEFPVEINMQALHNFLSLQYINGPISMFKNTYKVEPGSFLKIDTDSGLILGKKYWIPDYTNKTEISTEKTEETLMDLMRDAVKTRLISEVPLGCFLSGGTDSTIITAIASSLSQTQISTFSIGFNEPEYDERKYARLASNIYKTSHHEKIVTPNDLNIVKKLVRHFGEPFADSSMIPTFLLSEFTKEFVTVALTGDGADELFGGYYRYTAYKMTQSSGFIPSFAKKAFLKFMIALSPHGKSDRCISNKLTRTLELITTPMELKYYNLMSKANEQLKEKIYGSILKDSEKDNTEKLFLHLDKICTAADPFEKILEIDLNSYLPYDLLKKVDITSMANSLEVRSPFLDYRIVEFASSLPLRLKYNLLSRKKILRSAYRKTIPPKIMKRQKKGFGVPIATWLRAQWKETSKSLILDGESIKNGFFNKHEISKLLQEHHSCKYDHSYTIWAIIVFELWYQEFVCAKTSNIKNLY